MFRKEFISVITNTGMLTLKELKPYLENRDITHISEFDLLKEENFDDVKLAKSAAEKFGLPFIDLSNAKIKSDITGVVKKQVLLRNRVIPIQRSPKGITLATYDPTLKSELKELRGAFRAPCDLIITTLSAWKKIYENVNESLDEIISTIREIKGGAEQNKEIKEEDIGEEVIIHVNKILADAYIKKASDIHIEPYEKIFRIRLRIDGKLYILDNPPPKSMMLPIISRLKIMSQLDIGEKRKPQDGRIKLEIAGKAIDYRVSCLPTLFGEKVVLRLLDQSNLEVDMTNLGFEADQLKTFMNGIHQPFGMCLVTGPTGSGKTTTLYSGLAELNKTSENISTAEDPVEFNFEGVNQVNINPKAGLTFPKALKAFLRQDPDIIMVGEIRDAEVGEIAIEAALTGHMVLSTLHTNDAPGTITRLIQMGIDDFLVAAAVNVVVAQRLARRICESCKKPDAETTVEELIAAGISPKSAPRVKLYHGVGCGNCNQSGYKGRVAIFEVLNMSPAIKEIVLRKGNSDEIKYQAMKDGMKTLRMCGLTKMAQGVTSLEEVLSCSSSDSFNKK